MEDPKLAKGIVKREVVRIVTPGTNINTQALDETKNNYIMCIVYIADRYGLSVADVSTGDYFVTELDSGRKLLGAGLIGHFPAYGSHDGHVVRHMDAVGLQLLLQVAQHGIQARSHLLGRHHQRYRVDAGGQVVHVDAVALQHTSLIASAYINKMSA